MLRACDISLVSACAVLSREDTAEEMKKILSGGL